MLKRLFIPLLLIFTIDANGATVDTVSIYSKAMNKEYKCVVIKPDQFKSFAVPVVYLLHGYGGWYSNWITRVPELKDYADRYQLMIVCPEGLNSWYFDSPVDSTYRFETYISKEVPEYVDSHYLTIKDRKARAITGLSMGGHGGLFLGIRHADLFGACGSMSGGVDLNYSRSKFEVAKRIGDTVNYADNWRTYSVIDLVEHMGKDTAAMIIDCGYNDIFYKDNHALHEKMIQLKIPHEYTERPGKHDWTYWKNSIQYHLLFFRNYFDKNKPAVKIN